MPYIKQEQRSVYDNAIQELATLIKEHGANAGHLNYVISKLILESHNWQFDYEKFNKVVGVLTCVKDEFYRVFISPYEDMKMGINGRL